MRCGLAACVSVASGTTEWLQDIWGAGANDIWAVGRHGTILHWDGAAWSRTPSPTTLDLVAVSGTGTHDVWAAGACGTVLHWDGTDWSLTTLASELAPNARQLWARAPDEVWVLGSQTLLRFEGRCWTDLSADLETALVRSRFGADTMDAGPTSVSFDRLSGSESGLLVTGSVTSSNEFVGPSVMARFDGRVWTSPSPQGSQSWGLSSSLPRDAWPPDWMDQQRWQIAASIPPVEPDGWTIGGSAYEVFDDVQHHQGGVTTTLTSGANLTINGLWGTAENNVLAVDQGGRLLRFDGSTWRIEATNLRGVTAGGLGRNLVDVWAARADDVWAVGDRLVAHFDGTAWTDLADDVGRYRSVWGSGPNDVWAVGSDGIGHWDGTQWTLDRTMSGTWFEEVSGSGPRDVWAVGHTEEVWGAGIAVHFDGTAWTRAQMPTGVLPLLGVSALPNRHAWAVGGIVRQGTTESVILHFDGGMWSVESLADRSPTPWLRAVWAASTGEVWAGSSRVLRRTETGWADIPVPPGLSIRQIWGRAASGLWFAGSYGFILRFQ